MRNSYSCRASAITVSIPSQPRPIRSSEIFWQRNRVNSVLSESRQLRNLGKSSLTPQNSSIKSQRQTTKCDGDFGANGRKAFEILFSVAVFLDAEVIHRNKLDLIAERYLRHCDGDCELKRAITDLGLVGIAMSRQGLKEHLGSQIYWPIYAVAPRSLRFGLCVNEPSSETS